jgi:hypothetical protein
MLLATKKYNVMAGSAKPHALVVMLVIGVIFISQLKNYTHKAFLNTYQYHRFSPSDVYEELVTEAKKDVGPIIVSPGVQGVFYPQLRTGRPMIVPSSLDVFDKPKNSVIPVFCITDSSPPFPKSWDNVQPCFENRSVSEWNIIAKETTASGFMTPDTWKLKIKPVITRGGLAYYRISKSAEG